MAAHKPQRFTALAARQLLRSGSQASLSSLRQDGSPYGSLVSIATAISGAPMLFISELAWHTRNLRHDGRASLMVAGDLPVSDPLAGARISIMGQFRPIDSKMAKDRYLAHHPEAAGYIGFGDFSFWEMDVSECHAVAGFGRIETFAGADFLIHASAAERFMAETQGATDHMNLDHADTVAAYATGLLGLEAGAWQVAAIDPDGMDLVMGTKSARLGFPEPVLDDLGLREMLQRLAMLARQRANT